MKSLLVRLGGIVLGAVLLVGAPPAKANVPIGPINAIDSTDRDSIPATQTHWSGKALVSPSTGTSLVIQNAHVNAYSCILVTPENAPVTSGGVGVSVTSVSPGTFTVSLPNVVGTGSGRITGLNYLVINPGSDGNGDTTAQTDWSGHVSVPSSEDTSFVVRDTHLYLGSTIIITPVTTSAILNELTITSVGSGSFTVGSKNAMGSGDGAITAVNYLIINQ